MKEIIPDYKLCARLVPKSIKTIEFFLCCRCRDLCKIKSTPNWYNRILDISQVI